MRAMILAAGRGERMQPLTDYLPKPLLQVGNKPLIVYHIEAFAQSGIRDIVINVCHLGEKIQKTLGNGSEWGVNIQYSVEEKLLSTGGGILKALPLLGKEPFIVVSGDVWTDFPFSSLPPKLSTVAHVVLVDNPDHHPRGDFALKEGYAALEGKLFNYANIGVYHPDFFKECQTEVFALGPLLRQAISENKVSASYYSGRWHNIGTVEQLMQINNTYFQESAFIDQ